MTQISGKTVVVALFTLASAAAPQTPPPIRPLGRVLATSSDSLTTVSQVRVLRDGRVIVNDLLGRRVVLFDSTLQHVTVIADTSAATARAIGARPGGLIGFPGDSSLYVDVTAVTLRVIDPDGKFGRAMAAPNPTDAQWLVGGPYGTPGIDPQGRLVYRSLIHFAGKREADGTPVQPDSALIVRFDFVSRRLDTVATLGTPKIRQIAIGFNRTTGQANSFNPVINPVAWTDDWAMLPDGTIAIVRGRDYRVDFVDAHGKMTSGPKLPFEWQRLSDDDKTNILDSTKTAIEKMRAAQLARIARPGFTPQPMQFVTINELPEYRPAFQAGAVRADADGNLWVRTSKMVNGGAVYDVINNNGTLIDRVQMRPGRVIAGFAVGGVVYLGVADGEITRLERARVH